MKRVVAAVIEKDGKLLVCQRTRHQTMPLKWEFPGGKIEEGEQPRHALCRELEEGAGAVFLPEAGVLVAGDMCSDVEIPLLDPGTPDPVGDYRVGLGRLAALTGVRRVVPGHGHVGDAAEFSRRIAADHRYLDALERGAPFEDPRLTQDWLRAEHERQLRHAGPGPR